MSKPLVLIGMFDSPFVRRTAVSAALLGIPYEHRNWSVGSDFDRIRSFNPLGRVPTLVLGDGEALIESAVILDYLDEMAGEARALVPRSGSERRQVLRIIALASGAAEKGVAQIYERAFRPEEKRHPEWVARCASQMHGALAELDRVATACSGTWLVGDQMSQADVTTTCVFTFLREALAIDAAVYPALASLSDRCEALPVFRAVRVEFYPPG
jgi:glutathione S-transferase